MSEDFNRVIIKRASYLLEFPQLYCSVWILGDGADEAAFAPIFAKAACYQAPSMEEADFVVFTGGPDVDPALYREETHRQTVVDRDRDKRDIKAYNTCKQKGIPMIGVCRGAQFLHVMNGGKLYQDVTGHSQSHQVTDIVEQINLPNVSSVHHQLCMDNRAGGMTVIAVASVADRKVVNLTETHSKDTPDIEAFFYGDTCCLGVQGHPEYKGFDHYTNWFVKKIEHYVCNNSHIEVEDTVIRFRPPAKKKSPARQKSKKKEIV